MSQAIVIVSSPFITRLYGPEIFGLSSLFVTLVAFGLSFSAMGYPIAIVLPKKDSTAAALLRLSFVASLATSLTIAIFLVPFGEALVATLNAPKLSDFLWLIPIAVFAATMHQSLSFWFTRKKQFKTIASATFFTQLTANVSKIAAGFYFPLVKTLILIGIAGNLLNSFLLFTNSDRKKHPAHNLHVTARDYWSLIQKYKDFAIFRTPQNALSAASVSFAVFTISYFSGSASVGFYAIAMTVLALPSTVIGKPVMDVFYPNVTEAHEHGYGVRRLIIKATLGLAVIGSAPLLLLVLFGPSLFSIVFGDEWAKAGTYAQLLAVLAFFQLINKPAVAATAPLGLQKGLLIFELFNSTLRIAAMICGFVLLGSDIHAIGLYTLFGVIAYIILIGWILKRSGTKSVNKQDQSV